MVDDVFRSYRNHNTVAREGSETSRGGIGNLLAELAQLTGQGLPCRDGGRDDGSFQARGDNTAPELRPRGEDHYVALRRRQSSPVPREHGKQKKPPTDRHFSRPAVKFNGCRGEASDHSAAVNKLQYSDARTQGSRFHPAEKIGSRLCRTPGHRRSCPQCPMTATMARCSRPRLTNSRARAGGSSW
jgi:hypothetical protein